MTINEDATNFLKYAFSPANDGGTKHLAQSDEKYGVLAKRLIADTCGKQEIEPGRLTIHADRGSSMTSKPVVFLMADLGITRTHSRPHVSDDNPYSESHFKLRPRSSAFSRRVPSNGKDSQT